MKKRLILGLLFAFVCGAYGNVAKLTSSKLEPAVRANLDKYNVVWESPSQDENGSMPIGNGDLASNFWVEPNGDIVFYLSKSDAWNGEQYLLKLGRLRISPDKSLFEEGGTYKQELDLATGAIRIETRRATLVFWVDANRNVVNVEIKASELFGAEVTLETWRTPEAERPFGSEPDTILPAEGNTIRWYHRNTHSIFAESLRVQHLGEFVDDYEDPLINLTFGGLVYGPGLESKEDGTLVTQAPTKQLYLRVQAQTAQTETPEEWVDMIENQRTEVDTVPLEEARKAHEAWWADFWSQSYIFASGTPEAETATRAYVLQRWVQAGAGRGEYPIKFNGSLFTVFGKDNGQDFGPDYRRWGGCYWFQNTRLSYWPMLYSGDLDQMEPLWEMYREAIPLLKDRTKTYFGHDGIYISETVYPWGLHSIGDFGRGNPGFIPTNPYMRYNWDAGFELSMMMLDRYVQSPDEEFVRSTLLPITDEVVKFYDQHYERTAKGKVHFSPSMSLETWHSAEDPLPVVAGLHAVLPRLLELPETLTSPEQRARWKRFLSELPEIPVGEEDGKRWIKPAHVYSDKKNQENPELYAIFPYRVYGVGKPDLEVALEAWERRAFKLTGSWRQDAIQAAMMGLTDEAKGYMLQNATPIASTRFPAFYGPNFDWTPDQCHASVTMIALQRMLMQIDGDTIRLLPAWPKEWNVDFKLHAPHNTTVEGRVEDGKVIKGKVTPESRRKDIIIMEPKN